MARRTTITDEQILDAARRVFLEEGFAAPTAKIARLAGVSEGSIFNRFSTKEALFYESLGVDPQASWHRKAESLRHEWRGEEGMIELFVEILAFFNEAMPRLFVMFGNRVGAPAFDLFRGLFQNPRDRDLSVLGGLVASQIAAGNVRPVDPGFTAEFILGALVYPVMHSVFARQPLRSEDLPKIAEATVGLVWRGVAQPA